MQELQERVTCLNDSGEFQEVESNYSGKNSHIPSQPAVVPSPCSMLGRDKRLPLNDNVKDFDTRWDEVLLSVTKIPSDDILESLYKLRIRESDQLKTVLELYDMEIHQKISMPNYQKLKTTVKRRKDQKLRLRNFDARKEN